MRATAAAVAVVLWAGASPAYADDAITRAAGGTNDTASPASTDEGAEAAPPPAAVADEALAAPARTGFYRGLELQAGTDFPLTFLARARLLMPAGLGLGVGVGYAPGVYVNMISDVCVSLGCYTEDQGEVVKTAIQNSLYFDTNLDWDPWDAGGFHFGFGYSMLTLGGKASVLSSLEAFAGYDFPDELVAAAEAKDLGIPLSTTVHNVTLNIGYIWMLTDHLSLTTDFTLAKPLASSTGLDTSDLESRGGANAERAQALAERRAAQGNAPVQQAVADLESEVDTYMNDLYVKYVYLPTIRMLVGWRF